MIEAITINSISLSDSFTEICNRIIGSLREFYDGPTDSQLPKDRFPNLIASSNGKSILIPDSVSLDISLFSRRWFAQRPSLGGQLANSDLEKLGRRAFADALSEIELSGDPAKLSLEVFSAVDRRLSADASALEGERSYICGCWLVRDQPLKIKIGPVLFEPREQWLDRILSEDRISSTTARRIRRRWAGIRVKKRKATWDSYREDALVDTVGNCPDICTVTIHNMASAIGENKAFLTARLALMTVALLWERPSKALEGFGLLIDGNRQLISTLNDGPNQETFAWGRSARKLKGSTWLSGNEWSALWGDSQWLSHPCGVALEAFADGKMPATLTSLSRTIFLALWWFYEACESDSALMATVKFGAVLDVLSNGKSKAGIEKMVESVLGVPSGAPLTRDGETVKTIVSRIYGDGRSQTLHGLNDRFGHDWSHTRDISESIARECLVRTVDWVNENPDAKQLPDYFLQRQSI